MFPKDYVITTTVVAVLWLRIKTEILIVSQ